MASIYKSLSSKNKTGEAQLYFYLINGKHGGRVRIRTGIFVPIQYWNDKKKTLSIPKKLIGNQLYELRSIKESIDKAELQTFKLLELYGIEAGKDFYNQALLLLKDYHGVLSKSIVDRMMNKSNESEDETPLVIDKNIFSLAQEYLESKTYSQESINHFRVVFRSMARFEFYCNNIKHIPFEWDIDTIKERDIENYFTYIEKEHIIFSKHAKKYANMKKIYNDYFMPKKQNRDFEERGENSIVKFKKKVKTFWNWLLKKRYTTNNPLQNISAGVEKYGTPYLLTIEERNKIENHDFSGNRHLKVQRDILIFQCFVGCRYGDLLRLTPDNIVNGELIFTPHKTKDESKSFLVTIPLDQKAIDIIEEYKGVDEQGRILPFISEQKFNDSIKVILTECGITRMVNVRNPKTGENEMKPLNEIGSSHMLRRSFAGIMYNAGVDPDVICRMTGHVEGSRAFLRYRKIEDDKLKKAIEKLR